MSFSFNGPSFKPIIQESQAMKNNGGGGNTGYYKRGKKKKEETLDIFSEVDEKDSFESSEENENNDINYKENILDKIVEKTKKIVQKVQETKDTNNPFKTQG